MKVVAKVAKKKNVDVKIVTGYIRLDAALKLSGAVGTGGQAKTVILEGDVKVNGEACEQRGKKLRENDTFEFMRTIYKIVK